nr:hypothetical protein CJLB15_00047 [Campylobacter phage CJLB-15]
MLIHSFSCCFEPIILLFIKLINYLETFYLMNLNHHYDLTYYLFMLLSIVFLIT